MKTILGKRYVIAPTANGRFFNCRSDDGLYLTWENGGRLRWTIHESLAFIYDTRDGAENHVRPYLDKPMMTPEERKAALVACGWEDE